MNLIYTKSLNLKQKQGIKINLYVSISTQLTIFWFYPLSGCGGVIEMGVHVAHNIVLSPYNTGMMCTWLFKVCSG